MGDKNIFLRMCRLSCPFNDDGSHKFKSWKNSAKVKITRAEDNPLVQGVKGGPVTSAEGLLNLIIEETPLKSIVRIELH